MSGIIGHLVRRGVQAITTQPAANEFHTAILQWQVKQMDTVKKVQTWEIAIVALTFVAFSLLYVSVSYTLGDVVSSLAMIEQPGATASISVSDDPEAPLEKEARIEVVKESPITSSIRKTVGHLDHLGGLTARWRGFGAGTIYSMAHTFTAHFLASVFTSVAGAGPLGFFFSSILASVLTSRLHMTWTHVMISLPSTLPWYKRIPKGRFYFKALALPSFVLALSQQLFVILPAAVFLLFGTVPSTAQEANMNFETCRFLATLGTAALVGIAILLPASVTLTRVEASLLPDDQETVVKFDRTLSGTAASAISLGPVNVRSLFVNAWRTFDRASRLRLIKFYTKMFMIQISIIVLFFVVIAAEIFTFGPERLITLSKSGIAAAQLNAMGAPLQ